MRVSGGLGPSKGHGGPRHGRLAASGEPLALEAALPCWSCARYPACGAPLSGAPGGPSGKATVACKWQARFQADSPPPGWHGRQGAGRLAGSAFYCCCAAVPAEPSTAEYRWCLFNLAPPPRLSFNCSIPVPSNKLWALLKHRASYSYSQSSSNFMVRLLEEL